MSISRFNFNGGELCPELRYRPDLQKYQVSLEECTNFELTEYGALKRRPGIRVLSHLGQINNTYSVIEGMRCLPFSATATEQYVVVLMAQAAETGRADMVVVDSSEGYIVYNTQGESATPLPYSPDDLREISYVQINDIMYIAHRSHPPKKLSRYDGSWTLEDASILNGPYLPWDDQGPTLEVDDNSYAYDGSPNCQITASDDIFTSEWVGRQIRVTEKRGKSYTYQSPGGTGSITAGTVIIDPFIPSHEVKTEVRGKWKGTIFLEEYDSRTESWDRIATFTSEKQTIVNFSATRFIDRPESLLRVIADPDDDNMDIGASTGGLRVVITCKGESFRYATITGYNSSTEVEAVIDVTSDGGSTDTQAPRSFTADRWYEPVWNEQDGYAETVTLFDERLVFGGSGRRPQQIWMSRVDEWDNFQYAEDDASPLTITIAADNRNQIRGLAELRKDLIIFTDTAEFALSVRNANDGLTPGNFKVSRLAGYGAAKVKPAYASNRVYYSQSDRLKMRTLIYDFESDNYVSINASLLGYHLHAGGIEEMAGAGDRVYALTSDGTLSSYLHDGLQQIDGWNRYEFENDNWSIESICSLAPTANDQKQIAMIVTTHPESSFCFLCLYSSQDEVYRDGWQEISTDGITGTMLSQSEIFGPVSPYLYNPSTLEQLIPNIEYSFHASSETGTLFYAYGVTATRWRMTQSDGTTLILPESVMHFRQVPYSKSAAPINVSQGGTLVFTNLLSAATVSSSGYLLQYHDGTDWTTASTYYADRKECFYINMLAWPTGETLNVKGSITTEVYPADRIVPFGQSFLIIPSNPSETFMVTNSSGDLGINDYYFSLENISIIQTSTNLDSVILANSETFSSTMRTTDLLAGDQQLGKRARATSVRLYLPVNSGGGTVYIGDGNSDESQSFDADTGEIERRINSGSRDKLTVKVEADTAFPMTVAALAMDAKRTER